MVAEQLVSESKKKKLVLKGTQKLVEKVGFDLVLIVVVIVVDLDCTAIKRQ
jgi:hypothetical protein